MKIIDQTHMEATSGRFYPNELNDCQCTCTIDEEQLAPDQEHKKPHTNEGCRSILFFQGLIFGLRCDSVKAVKPGHALYSLKIQYAHHARKDEDPDRSTAEAGHGKFNVDAQRFPTLESNGCGFGAMVAMHRCDVFCSICSVKWSNASLR